MPHTASSPLRPALLLAAAALLLLPGCLVLEERFVQKEREADTLREAVARTNRLNAECESKGSALSDELAKSRKAGEELAARVKAQDEEIGRLKGNLSETKKDYEGSTISREELIRELLEKEKGTGKRIQELALEASDAKGKAEGLRRELDAARAEAEARKDEAAGLRKALEGKPSEDELRRERDLLLGRVERLDEERADRARRRGKMLAELAGRIPAVAPGSTAVVEGTLLRVTLPEAGKEREGDAAAPKKWAAAASEAAEAFRGEEGCLLALSAPPAEAEEMRKAVVEGGRFPADAVLLLPPPAPGRAELLLKAP